MFQLYGVAIFSASSLAANPVFRAHTKHAEVDYHFIREKIGSKQLQVAHISSMDQLADLFTKPLATARFNYLKDKLIQASVASNPTSA